MRLPAVALGAGPTHLGVYLKTYYTDFQLVTDCAAHHRLTAADVAKAKDALAKIEAHYLQRDPAINKDKLMKQALANNKVAYKMMAETQGRPGVFCRSSLNDLKSKLHDLEPTPRRKRAAPDAISATPRCCS